LARKLVRNCCFRWVGFPPNPL